VIHEQAWQSVWTGISASGPTRQTWVTSRRANSAGAIAGGPRQPERAAQPDWMMQRKTLHSGTGISAVQKSQAAHVQPRRDTTFLPLTRRNISSTVLRNAPGTKPAVNVGSVVATGGNAPPPVVMNTLRASGGKDVGQLGSLLSARNSSGCPRSAGSGLAHSGSSTGLPGSSREGTGNLSGVACSGGSSGAGSSYRCGSREGTYPSLTAINANGALGRGPSLPQQQPRRSDATSVTSRSPASCHQRSDATSSCSPVCTPPRIQMQGSSPRVPSLIGQWSSPKRSTKPVMLGANTTPQTPSALVSSPAEPTSRQGEHSLAPRTSHSAPAGAGRLLQPGGLQQLQLKADNSRQSASSSSTGSSNRSHSCSRSRNPNSSSSKGCWAADLQLQGCQAMPMHLAMLARRGQDGHLPAEATRGPPCEVLPAATRDSLGPAKPVAAARRGAAHRRPWAVGCTPACRCKTGLGQHCTDLSSRLAAGL